MYSKRLMKNERPNFPKRAVITAGMPYGNKNLHFGHVGGMFVHADIFARFLRDRIGKENVIFVSGTDCYGSPIQESYRKLKEAGYDGAIEDYVTLNHENQKKTLENYGISLNFFGASALGEAGEIHKKVSAGIFHTLYENNYIKKMSVPQFYDEEKGVFLNGRQVVGRCPIPGCCSERAYAEECSLGHQFLPSELINPISCLSGKTPKLKDLTFWVWPESLWAPISFTYAYLKKNCSEDEISKWWNDEEALVYQFIGEDNIYFYAIAQTGLFTGLRAPKGEKLDVESLRMSHIIANRHLLYMDAKASSSSEIKPPMADELLSYYTKDQLRMHFMSLGLSSKSVGFKPQVFMKREEQTGVDMVLKEGNLLTNVFNRLIRSCFYACQNNCGGKLPEGEVNEKIIAMAENAVLEYARFMYNHEFHRISYLLDNFIREVNKYWVNNVRQADIKGDTELRRQIVIDCFYACKVIAVLVHPITPEGCEMFREYLNLGEELWDWEYIMEPIAYYVEDLKVHKLKLLPPRVDFFKKHNIQ